MIRTVLFDLDGTLADTAPDLAAALNKLLLEEGRAPLPFATIRPFVSHGATALVTLGFGAEHVQFAVLRERLLQHYAADVCRETRVFPGIAELLAALTARSIGWGIVTNKQAFLTDPLVKQLLEDMDCPLPPPSMASPTTFDQPQPAHPHAGGQRHERTLRAFATTPLRPVCVVSGDTTQNRKPHPEPMLHACAIARVAPADCLYVGDAERDIQAGREAGMKTLVALFGYIGDNETPAQWGADGMVREPLEILDWIDDQEHARHAL